jgi:uncharacterized membrane protein
VIAYFLFVRALRLSDASLVTPIVLVTPVLMLATSPLILGEQVPPLGAAGVILSVLGAGLLGESELNASPRLSFVVLLRNSGVRSMFAAATIWSIMANLDKLGIRASTPLLWVATITTYIALCSTIFWLTAPHRPLHLRDVRHAVLAGVANARLRRCQHQSLLVRARIFSPSFDRRDDLDTAHRGVTILRLVTLS